MSMVHAPRNGWPGAREGAEGDSEKARRGARGPVILSLAALAALAAASGAFSAPARETHVTRAHLAKAIEREVIAERFAAPAPALMISAPALAPPVDPGPARIVLGDADVAAHYGEALSPWLAPEGDEP